MTTTIMIASIIAAGGIIAALAFQFGVRAAMNAIYDGAALILGLCRAAADTRTVDDGRAFGGDE